MIEDVRRNFNGQDVVSLRQQVLHMTQKHYGVGDADIPPASKSPVFISWKEVDQLNQNSLRIMETIRSKGFLRKAAELLPEGFPVPDEPPKLSVVDYSRVNGGWSILEAQGFPSILLGFTLQARFWKHLCPELNDTSALWGFRDEDEAIRYLRKFFGVDDHHVILADRAPQEQPTWLDFRLLEEVVGLKIVNFADIVVENGGRKAYYLEGKTKRWIDGIHCRAVPDELQSYGLFPLLQKLVQPRVEVTWYDHPSYYFLFSKGTLPFISQHPYVCPTTALTQANLGSLPYDDVLKRISGYGSKSVFFKHKHNATEWERKLNQAAGEGGYIVQPWQELQPCVLMPNGEEYCLEVRSVIVGDRVVSHLARVALPGNTIGVGSKKDDLYGGAALLLIQ